MIVFIVLVYMLLGFVVGLLSKESKFDKGWRVLLWFIGWPVLGIIVNRRGDVVAEEELRPDGLVAEHVYVDECDGCMLQDLTNADNDHILTCLKCRRSYVEGSDEREEYSDYYIAEEEK